MYTYLLISIRYLFEINICIQNVSLKYDLVLHIAFKNINIF